MRDLTVNMFNRINHGFSDFLIRVYDITESKIIIPRSQITARDLRISFDPLMLPVEAVLDVILLLNQIHRLDVGRIITRSRADNALQIRAVLLLDISARPPFQILPGCIDVFAF